jgi:hypothetical protein
MRITLAAALIAAALVPAGAGAAEVKSDHDSAYDFSKIKTFAIKLGTGWGNPLSEKRVVDEFTQALTAKGWKTAAEDAADAIVVLHGATEKQKNLNTFYSGMGGYGGWGYRGFGGGMGTSTTTVSEYLVGTLVVDIFDRNTKALVFRGTATDEISDKPEKNVKKVEKVTEKMFKKFPPGAAKS